MSCFGSRVVLVLARGMSRVVLLGPAPVEEVEEQVLVRTSFSAFFLACLAVVVRVFALVPVAPGPRLGF